MWPAKSTVGVLAVCLCVVLTGVGAVGAQTPPAPRIDSVVVDSTGSTLVVSGARFGEGAEILVDGRSVPLLSGATDTRLEVELPPVWRAQPGTYRLTVRTAQGRTDTFEVTIGGAGAPSASLPTESEARVVPRPPALAPTGEAALGATLIPVAPSVIEDPGAPYRTAIGSGALGKNTTGQSNTAAGSGALRLNTTGSSNMAAGAWALSNNTTGQYNTAAGASSLQFNTTGSNNAAAGTSALFSNTTGSNNTAAGNGALFSNTTGQYNTAAGTSALFSNTTGSYNTAAGYGALSDATTGSSNNAFGSGALKSNTTGGSNIAIGNQALFNNKTGSNNTAAGIWALQVNTTGSYNTAVGTYTLLRNTTGLENMAAGNWALAYNTTGQGNTAVGLVALTSNKTGSYNTALGRSALYYTTGHRNVGVGWKAGSKQTTGSDNVYIANEGVAAESGAIRLGTKGVHTKIYVAGISTFILASTKAVRVDNDGRLGYQISSQRFKEDIQDMDAASAGLFQLRPVTYRYKGSADRTTQFGLIAEEVAKVYPDLVTRDDEGRVETVLYDQLPSLMLNELQKQQRTVTAQAEQLASQARELSTQAEQLAAQASQLALLQQRLAELEARLTKPPEAGPR